MQQPEYSIIIPCYNEAERLAPSLDKILEYVEQQHLNAEIIVVDDGSSDATAEITHDFARRFPCLRLVSNPGNRGKGYSVRHGMLEARGRILLFTDSDLSSPIQEAGKLFREIHAGADVAIGSRWLHAETQTGRQSLLRQVFGRTFNLLAHGLLGLKFKDTQCGFKAFSRRAADAIFPLQQIEHWGFDPELLYLAGKFEFKVKEVAVEWAHDPRSKINPVTSGMAMFVEMLRIRWYGLTGKYDSALPYPAARQGGV